MTILTRRDVLFGAALGAVNATSVRLALARDTGRTPLPIPPELTPDNQGVISLSARGAQTAFKPTGMTATFGYNGPYLGPALRVRRGTTATIDFRNNLAEPTTVHWHGLIIPGAVDGGPHLAVAPGGRWRPALPIDQPAATLWYHPHLYPSAARQVMKGLAGLLIIDDDEADRLQLPSRWGIDDVPLILQDRRFRHDGQFFDRMNLTAVTSGYVGNVGLVNGVRYPEARTSRGWVRLRILDGSNARSYLLKASDDRSLFVVGSDGGLLEAPVEMKQIMMYAGERFEVVVDCRSGLPFDLVTMPVGDAIMRLPPFDNPMPLVTIRPEGADGTATLPSVLAKLPPLPAALPAISHDLMMNMFRDKEGMAPLMKAGLRMGPGGGNRMPMPMGITAGSVTARVDGLIEGQPELSRAERLSMNGISGKSYALDEPGFAVQRGRDLRWRVSEGNDPMLHPVHVHGCQFRIVSQNGGAPEPYRTGWKDIAPIDKGSASEILLSFPHPAGPEAPYMAHCHVLEHEDSGMMTQFTVA